METKRHDEQCQQAPGTSTAVPPASTCLGSAEYREKAEQEARQRKKYETWSNLVRERGRRYATCRLDNYVVQHAGQQEVVDAVTEYCQNITQNVEDGEGILLIGPSGSGKDHLIMAAAREAIKTLAGAPDKYYPQYGELVPQFSIVWTSGVRLYTAVRDAMRKDAEDTEVEIKQRYVRANILMMSDPIPPGGALTPFQAEVLEYIIDRRYSMCRPTWISLNCASRESIEAAMSTPIVDRLVHGALVLACDWPSYRTPLTRVVS